MDGQAKVIGAIAHGFARAAKLQSDLTNKVAAPYKISQKIVVFFVPWSAMGRPRD